MNPTHYLAFAAVILAAVVLIYTIKAPRILHSCRWCHFLFDERGRQTRPSMNDYISAERYTCPHCARQQEAK